jgi:hypothetical protein
VRLGRDGLAVGREQRRAGPGSAAGHEYGADRERAVGDTSDRCGAGEKTPDSGNKRFMQIPGVHIETLHNPTRYSYAQIEKACTLAALLNRGKLVLVEPPRNA